MTAIDTDIKEVQHMFDVNVFGPIRMIHHFHDLLINASGTVVNIGSVGGISPYPYGGQFFTACSARYYLDCPIDNSI
jgi:1-acylglycerone phosphate reductase